MVRIQQELAQLCALSLQPHQLKLIHMNPPVDAYKPAQTTTSEMTQQLSENAGMTLSCAAMAGAILTPISAQASVRVLFQSTAMVTIQITSARLSAVPAPTLTTSHLLEDACILVQPHLIALEIPQPIPASCTVSRLQPGLTAPPGNASQSARVQPMLRILPLLV